VGVKKIGFGERIVRLGFKSLGKIFLIVVESFNFISEVNRLAWF